jgi:predicted glycosyltransferase
VRILFDLSHPAHVHQFVPLAHELTGRGHRIRLVGRDKDVTRDLLKSSGLPFEVPDAPAGPRGRVRDGRELVTRVRALRRIVRAWRPDVLLTRNPSGVLATFGTLTRSVFDTDDGRQAGAHYWLARPIANLITSSVHDPESHGRHHRRYPSFKALAYLHPDRYAPDPAARDRYGVPEGPLFVLRFSAHDASHDRRVTGISEEMQQQLERLLESHGSVLLAREGEPTVLLTTGARRTVPPQAFLDLLAQADLCVGDSQSVAIEAALLGVPAIRLSGFTGRNFSLQVLEERYGLVSNFLPGDEPQLLALVVATLTDLHERRRAARAARDRLLDDAVDLTGWYLRLIDRRITSRYAE